jgi:hypothetical protein
MYPCTRKTCFWGKTPCHWAVGDKDFEKLLIVKGREFRGHCAFQMSGTECPLTWYKIKKKSRSSQPHRNKILDTCITYYKKKNENPFFLSTP